MPTCTHVARIWGCAQSRPLLGIIWADLSGRGVGSVGFRQKRELRLSPFDRGASTESSAGSAACPGRPVCADAGQAGRCRRSGSPSGSALALNDLIPATVQASVEAGLVTLSGIAVTWQFQRDEAELACAAVPGVMGVDVAISLHPAPADGDIEQAISAAFGRSARLDRFEISADSPFPGMVVLSGTVSSWAEHDDAVALAWSAPGITDIDDRIAVVY